MTHNPIYSGYIWRQAFDFPEGFFEVGDVVRAEFRRFANDAAPLGTVTEASAGNIRGVSTHSDSQGTIFFAAGRWRS